jgi:hypothetical protein
LLWYIHWPNAISALSLTHKSPRHTLLNAKLMEPFSFFLSSHRLQRGPLITDINPPSMERMERIELSLSFSHNANTMSRLLSWSIAMLVTMFYAFYAQEITFRNRIALAKCMSLHRHTLPATDCLPGLLARSRSLSQLLVTVTVTPLYFGS